MAPKRKQRSENNEASTTAATTTTRVTRSATRTTTKGTRSATRRGDAALKTPVADPEPRKRKKAKTSTTASSSAAAAKTVIIEHCKQCDSFKTRAIQVKNGLEKGVAGVNVVVNPEKPRKGCFEIREEGGEIFLSLLDMETPFAPLKALDMEKVISDIVERIKLWILVLCGFRVVGTHFLDG
ncbi:hypothetical protein Pfo_010350 [Paulownia fortunei]|nr:hypothetical protein Pfo_010350 [Paulownia fortunei]